MDIGFAAGMDVEVNRYAVCGGYDSDLKAATPTAFTCAPVPVGFMAQQPVAADAHVVTHGHRERADDVAGLGLQSPEELTKSCRQAPKHIDQVV